MTAKEVREALDTFSAGADVLVCINSTWHLYAVTSIGLSPGGLPTIRVTELPAGKAAQRS